MITVIIDLSASLGIPRNQGRRPTCSAFAASDINRHANAAVFDLSVEYLGHHAAKASPNWHSGIGFSTNSIIAAANAPGQPDELFYPYTTNPQQPEVTPPTGPAMLYAAALSRGKKVPEIFHAISFGRASMIVIRVTETLYRPVAGVVVYTDRYVPNKLHAVSGVGIGVDQAGDRYLRIKNSWGTDWGDYGYAWVPESFLNTHMTDGLTY